MIQSVVGFFRNLFSPILPNEWLYREKRQRDDDFIDIDIEDPPVKRQRMYRLDPSGSKYFPNPFYRNTNDKGSQVTEVIDLDPPTFTTISLLDDDSSPSDKENDTLKISKPSSSSKKSPQKSKSFKAPSHCRSPHKTKFKYVTHRRGSDDIEYVRTYSKDESHRSDLLSGNNSARPLLRRSGLSTRKPFLSRSEHLKSLPSFRSSDMYDMQSRIKYGELLSKVLKSPELFSCSSNQNTSQPASSHVIDLTKEELATSKSSISSSITSLKNASKTKDSFVDLTTPSQKQSSEIINLDDDPENVITAEKFCPDRKLISPFNTLSTKLKYIPCTNRDYISNLEADIENLKTNFAKEKEQLDKELSTASPLRKIFENALEERIRRHLRITSKDLDLEEEEEEEEPTKPQLSDQMISMVLNAWDSRKPRVQVLSNNFNYQIKRSDLQTLSGLNWLNDEVINFYMELISARGKQKDFPSVHTFSTFFYLKLEKDGHAGLRRWTRKIDIFSFDLIIVPIHLSVHWCLSVINLKKKTITYYDSMGQANNTCLNSLLKYLEDEHMDKKKEPFDTKSWVLTCTKDSVPQQMNSCDCGVFSCTFAEYSAREAKFKFSQEDMPYFRRKMTYEILSSQLLPWN